MVSFVSFAFISALICKISFLLLTLGFFISSFSSCFRCRVRLFIWLFSCFLRYACIAMNLLLSTAFTVSYRFWVVVFPFSFPTLLQPAPSQAGASSRSRERLGEARPGQSGLSAGDFYAYFDLFFLFLLWFIGYAAALCSASICWNFWSFFSCNWDLILLNCSQNKCLEWF